MPALPPAAAASLNEEPRASRYLASSGGDPAKASHLLTSTLLWRREFGVDELGLRAQQRSTFVARCACPCGVLEHRDKAGRGVIVARLGFSDPTAASMANAVGDESGLDAWLRHLVWCNEVAMRAHSERILVLDLANLSRRHVGTEALGALRRYIEIGQRHYPGSLHRCYIVHAPALLAAVWPSVKSYLSSSTAARVVITGSDTEAVRTALLAEMAEADLPAFLGGSFWPASGGVPVDPALREGFLPIDDECSCVVSSAAGSEMRVEIRLGAQPPPTRLCMRVMKYTGTATTALLRGRVELVGASGAAAGGEAAAASYVVLEPCVCEATGHAVAFEMCWPDAINAAGLTSATIVLNIDSEGGAWWRERHAFWELEGVRAAAWQVNETS